MGKTVNGDCICKRLTKLLFLSFRPRNAEAKDAQGRLGKIFMYAGKTQGIKSP